MKLHILILASFLLSSCAMNMGRTYLAQMESQEGERDFFAPNRDFRVVNGDNGKVWRNPKEIQDRTPGAINTHTERYEKSLKSELSQLESKLPEADLEQYQKVKGMFNNDSERIYYLKLSNAQERALYLETKGQFGNSIYNAREREMAASHQDVVLGMSKNLVMRSWGRPHRIDVAGNPRLENERWAYYLSSGRTRFIYFERGRVEGWTEDE